jgi:hypothetical protein
VSPYLYQSGECSQQFLSKVQTFHQNQSIQNSLTEMYYIILWVNYIIGRKTYYS